MKTNPTIQNKQLPIFSHILPDHIFPAVESLINLNRKELAELLKQKQFTWDNLLKPLEEIEDRFHRTWAPISHLHSVMESENLRAAYNKCLPIITEYHTEMMQNSELYNAIKSIHDSDAFKNYDTAQRKVIENNLRDFKLAGVHLSVDDKARFAALQQKLSLLSTQFAENVLDATHGWTLHVEETQAIKGLPETTVQLAAETAHIRNLSGYVFTLDHPCYSVMMKYLENRELRWLMYEAYSTRASDEGPNAHRWDNTPIMEEIVRTRFELAKLLGFENFATYALSTRMADSPEKVFSFLNELVKKSKAAAENEMNALKKFAKKFDGLEKLEAWDIAFYSEKMRQNAYAISQEELREFFPAPKVLHGMFAVVEKLYGLKIIEKQNADVWHPQVQFFEIYDAENILRGYFYTDLYARAHKRDGAWMDECRIRRQLANGVMQKPVAFLTCNFTPPLPPQPALLTHDDVITLFHEFGHCLHHLVTLAEYPCVAGINGVPWDAVEFPSQFFEHWCWEKEVLDLISENFKTGDKIPDALFKKMVAAKNFQSGMQMVRQLEFSLFDFHLHCDYDLSAGFQVQHILNQVRQQVSVITIPSFNRFQNSFSHVFAGGYAAGYYSYKWAEVLSSDAFSLFEEKGIFDKQTGKSFMENILEKGGVYHPMELFKNFRGREPHIDALLRHCGLTN